MNAAVAFNKLVDELYGESNPKAEYDRYAVAVQVIPEDCVTVHGTYHNVDDVITIGSSVLEGLRKQIKLSEFKNIVDFFSKARASRKLANAPTPNLAYAQGIQTLNWLFDKTHGYQAGIGRKLHEIEISAPKYFTKPRMDLILEKKGGVIATVIYFNRSDDIRKNSKFENILVQIALELTPEKSKQEAVEELRLFASSVKNN